MDEQTRIMTALEVKTFVEAGEGLLVNVLPPEEWAARRIPGSVGACVYEVVFLENMAAHGVKKDDPIVLYGAGPGSLDVETAEEKLRREGYENLAVFPGGLIAWAEAGYPFEGAAPDEDRPAHPELVFTRDAYEIDPNKSVIRWTGRNVNSSHSGTLRLSSGRLDVSGGRISGTCAVDMKSLSNEDLAGDAMQSVLESHLRSDDFFFVSAFPEAVFRIDFMRPIPNAAATMPNFHAEGELHLRGIRRSISFPANLRNTEDDGLAFVANLDFDRTLWGALYGSARYFKYLGYHVVFDMISLDLRIILA